MIARLVARPRGETEGRGDAGTRFRLFPAYDGEMPPETVALDRPPGSIGPGPSDPLLYVADAAAKPAPYDPPSDGPPYRGRLLPPALPDRAGNFDHIPLDSPQFLAAHLYGCVRRTLDIWQRYLGGKVRWFMADEFPRMELIPLVDWNNAQSGPGFMEMGLYRGPDGAMQPYAMNYDVVAHETGHAILFSRLGVPPPDAVGAPFLAFHESFADLTALIGVLHFRSVVGRLLAETQGNLYVLNLVNRIGETSAHIQIRLAANDATMDDVAGIALRPDGSWADSSGQGRNQHALAQPLTGAMFDMLVELYQDRLVADGLIVPDDDPRGWSREEVMAAFDDLHARGARQWRRFEGGFAHALHAARDRLGRAMAHAIDTLRPEGLSFGLVAARVIEALLAQGHGAQFEALLGAALARGIDPRPYLRFAPAGPPGRPARHFRPLLAAPATGCACHPGGWLRAARMQRAGHASLRAS